MSARFDSRGRWQSRGRQLLRRVLDGEGQASLARRCGCSQSTLSRLANGELVSDSYRLRKRIESATGIGMETWDQPQEPEASLSEDAVDYAPVHRASA